ncbi:MAG: InlB B-repeat-containing protein [Candidatus Berkelbacteria bacterium]
MSHENAGPLTNAILAVADNCADPKLRFSVDGSNKFSSIGGAYILTGKTYRPGGTVESMSWFYVYGTLDMVTNNFDGSMGSPSLYTGGTINAGTGTFNMSGYHQFAGTFNGNSATIIVGEYSFLVDSGIFNSTSGNMTLDSQGSAGNFSINGGTFNHNNGQVTFSNIGTGLTSDITSHGQHFYDLIANSANGNIVTLDSLYVDNTLRINAANILSASSYALEIKNLDQSAGSLVAPFGTMKVSGNFQRSAGNFNNNSGTVELNGVGGTTQIISGTNSFYNLTAAATANRTIQVAASTTQTVSNTLSINGTDASHKIILVSSNPGTRWNIDPQGTKSVSWVTVSDSTSSNPINAANSTEGTPGSTTNWLASTSHTLTYSAGANGSIVGTTPQTVADGGNGTQVVATPAAHYHFVSWSDAYPTATRTDLNVTGDITVSATFAIDTYTLTYSANANGSIVGTTPQTVNYNANGSQVVATPASHYHFVSWSDAYPTAARTDLAVSANITVSATFAIDTYTLTYSANANGSIVGTTPQTVNYGANGSQVTATPAAHYHFVSWSDAYPTAARTDLVVTGNITVSATFAIDTYTLTYSANANGSIVGTTPQTVNYNANGSQVVATPASHYHFVSWSDAYPTAARTDLAVSANITVSATFAIDTYTLTYSANANGSIVGTTPQTVNYGANGSQVTATPAAHYHFVSWSDAYPTAVRTDLNVAANITVSATFAIDTYTLTYSANANGSIVGSSPQTVNYGANGSQVVATPASHYHFVSWSDAYPTAARTDMNVISNKSVTASFAIDTFDIMTMADQHGSVSPTGTIAVSYGANQDIAFSADPGYYVSTLILDNTPISPSTSSPYQFISVSSNHTIAVTTAFNNTCVWTGLGVDSKWSTSLNWSGNAVPTPACDVIFNSTSTKESILDAGFTNHIKSLSINAGYTSTVALQHEMLDDGSLTLASGTLSPSSYTMSIGGSWNNTGGSFSKGTSTVIFSSSAAATVASNSNDFYNVIFSGSPSVTTPNVWVANYNTNNVSKILSTDGSKTGDFPTGSYSYGSAVDASGFVWVTNGGNDTVSKIDASTGAKIIDYPTGSLPKGVAIDANGFVWVANFSSGTVSKINPSTGSRTNYAAGSGSTGVAVDTAGFVWVTNYGGTGSVSKINASTGTKVGDYIAGLNPAGIAVSSDGYVWVANTLSNTVSKINASTGIKAADYSTGLSPTGVAVDSSGFVWITNTGANTVSKMSPTTGSKTDYPTGTSPAGVSVAADGYIWVANTTANTISRINPSSGTKTDHNVGTSPYSYGDMTGFALKQFVLGGNNDLVSNGFYSLSSNLIVSNDLTIASGVVSSAANGIVAGTFVQSGGYFIAPSTSLAVSQNFERTGGVFAHGSGTVSLVGSGASIQAVSGSTTFNNLFITATTARTIQFAGSSTQTILGTWTATGAANQFLSLGLKTGDSGVWNVYPAVWNIDYVDVSNSTNLATSMIAPAHYTSVSTTSNNKNWFSLAVTAHVITSSVVGANGSISPSGATSVADGATQNYTISPATGYHIMDIKIDGVSLIGTLANTYAFVNVTTNHTISVSFAANDICIWDGGGSDDSWSTAANWSNDTLPTAGCDVVFNGTSNKNSVIDNGFTSKIRTFTTNTGYSGTISANNDLTVSDNFTLNSGSFNAGSKKINIGGSLSMAANPFAIFDKGTGTINFNPTLTGKTITTNGQQLGNLTFNGVDRDLTGIVVAANNNVALIRNGTLTVGWTLQDNLSAVSIAANAGTLVDAGKSVTVAGNIYIAYKVGVLASTGLWTQSASGRIENYEMHNAFGGLTIAGAGVTTTFTNGIKIGLNDGSVGGLTMGPGTINGGSFSTVLYMPRNDGLTVNNPIIGSKLGTITMYPLGAISQKAFTLPNNFAPIQIQKGPSSKYTATGDFNFANNNLTINNDNITANTGYLDMGPYTLTCNNLTIGSAFGSARYPAYYQIAGGLKLSTGTINVAGNLAAANPLNFGNTLNLGSGTLNVGGNLDLNYITFTQGTSTVDLIGTGTLSAPSNAYFYNLKLAHQSKNTKIVSDLIRVNNILYAYSGGTLTDKFIYLYKSDGDPFIDSGTTLLNNSFFYMSKQNLEVSGHNFNSVSYRGYTNDVIFTLTSDMSANLMMVYSNTDSKSSTLNTSSNNINVKSILLGGVSAPDNLGSSATIDFGTGSHQIANSIARNPASTTATATMLLKESTVSIGGNIDFSNIAVIPGTSTVVMNGVAGSTQTIYGNNTFNNLKMTTSAARTIAFAAGTTQTISGMWTAKGLPNNLLTLALKTGDSGSWSINPATWDVQYVNVQNSINLAENKIYPLNSVDGGGNKNWFSPVAVIPAITDTVGTIVDNIVEGTKNVVGVISDFVQNTFEVVANSVVGQTLQAIFENVSVAVAAAAAAITNVLSKIGLTPEVASRVAAATAAVVTAVTVAAAPAVATGSLMNLGEIAHSVWQPVANLVAGRRRRNWGRVIEDGTGAPIQNTKINLVKVYRENPVVMYESQKVVASTYTDKNGKYGFIAEPGKYKLEIVKDNYEVVDTNSFLDFYHTNTLFEVKDYKQGLVIKDVAISSGKENLSKMFKITHLMQILSKILAYASFGFLVFGTVSIIPIVTGHLTPLNLGIIVLYSLLWFSNSKNLIKKSPWGTIVDKTKNINLPLVLVRIIDRKTGQLVKTAVSNEKGRFSTFIDKGDYEIRALKAGYALDKPIRYQVGKEKATLSKTIEMKPV